MPSSIETVWRKNCFRYPKVHPDQLRSAEKRRMCSTFQQPFPLYPLENKSCWILFVHLFLAVLWFELGALCLLGWCSTAWAKPPAHEFCFWLMLSACAKRQGRKIHKWHILLSVSQEWCPGCVFCTLVFSLKDLQRNASLILEASTVALLLRNFSF
jgi:hypothetical protein